MLCSFENIKKHYNLIEMFKQSRCQQQIQLKIVKGELGFEIKDIKNPYYYELIMTISYINEDKDFNIRWEKPDTKDYFL